MTEHVHEYRPTSTWHEAPAAAGYYQVPGPERCACGKVKPMGRLIFDPAANARAAVAMMRRPPWRGWQYPR